MKKKNTFEVAKNLIKHEFTKKLTASHILPWFFMNDAAELLPNTTEADYSGK